MFLTPVEAVMSQPVKVMREDGNGVRPATVTLRLDLRRSKLSIVR